MVDTAPKLNEKIQNRDSEYSKAALSKEAGQNAFQNVLRHYNAIALWLGFPSLLEKKID